MQRLELKLKRVGRNMVPSDGRVSEMVEENKMSWSRTPMILLLTTVATACSSTSPSASSSSSSGAPGADAGPTGCPVLLDGCLVYACTCKNGKSLPQVPGTAPSGVCESAASACARACVSDDGVGASACGTAPVLGDAGADVAPRAQCMAGLCNYSAEAVCKDNIIERLESACPDSGICPTVAEAAEEKCAPRGGVLRITAP